MTVYASTLPLPDAWYDRLAREVDGLEILRPDGAPDQWPDTVRSRVHVLHTGAVDVDPARLPALRFVQLDTSGVDHLHGSALWSSDVPLVTLGGLAPIAMAEYTALGLLSLAHHVPELQRGRAAREWSSAPERLARYTPVPVVGSRAVIVGYGRIGREIARVLRSLGVEVAGVRRDPTAIGAPRYHGGRTGDDVDPTPVSAFQQLDHLLGDADWVVLVLPLTDETRGSFDVVRLDAMKPGARLINIARGGILDERALLERIRSGRIGGAVLDVFDEEPLPPESPWWSEPGVIVTPHIAGLTPDYLTGTLDLVATNLRRIQHDEPLLNEVDRVRGY